MNQEDISKIVDEAIKLDNNVVAFAIITSNPETQEWEFALAGRYSELELFALFQELLNLEKSRLVSRNYYEPGSQN